MIRENYTPAVRSALDREVAKDLVKMPIHEIESFLFKAAGV
jgi:protein required for attachment to host cells